MHKNVEHVRESSACPRILTNKTYQDSPRCTKTIIFNRANCLLNSLLNCLLNCFLNCVLNCLIEQDIALQVKGFIGGWGVSPAGPPVTGKSFRVVPCVRTCVRAVLGLVRFQPNRGSCPFPFPLCRGRPFPFPFYPAGFSLFPCASICSLFPCEHLEEMDSNEIKWIHINSNEITLYQMKSHETKWIKVN